MKKMSLKKMSLQNVSFLVIGIVIVIVVLYATIANSDNKGPTATSTTPTPQATAATPQATAATPKATVTDNGKRQLVPLVDSAPKTASADTTKDPLTPASLPVGACPVLVDWAALVDCVDTNQDLSWYIDGVNQRSKQTGFDWSDIGSWAEAKNAKTTEVRAIEVFGGNISKAEARKRAAELVGAKTAKKLQIIRQPACFNNTRGLENGEMSNFVYCPPDSRQVRISLLPVEMKGDKIIAIVNTDSGVFIDCANLWWIPDIIKIPGTPPQKIPPKEVPPPTVVKKCPPGTTGNPPYCKDDPSKDPYAQGNAPRGGGKNANPGSGKYIAPKDMKKPGKKPRKNPVKPKPSPGKGNGNKSTPKPEPTFSHPAPEPSAPKPDKPETGCVAIPGVEDC
jgi:hypothetical protein